MAHKNTRKSPRPMENPSWMHSRYIPTAAMATLIHTVRGTRFFKNSPSTGTITIYSAVIKPAFPTVVWAMPNCCRLLLAQRKMPQQIPPSTAIRRCSFSVFPAFPTFPAFPVLPGSCGSSPDRWSPPSRLRKKIQGISTAPPIRNRQQLKVNPPT